MGILLVSLRVFIDNSTRNIQLYIPLKRYIYSISTRHRRHYTGQQTPAESRLQEYTLNTRTAQDAILHLKSNDFSAARKIITDSKPTKQPIGEQQCDKWLCKICHLLIMAEDSREFEWFVENIIFARNYASENALMVILSYQLDMRNDLDTATEYFLRIVGQFKKTPFSHLLLTKLIREEDDMNISRVIKSIEILHNKNLAQCLLAHAYTDCGDLVKASQIYSVLPKFELEQIKRLSQTVQNQWKIRFLQNFLESAKNCMDRKGRVILFETLIMMYSDEQNVEQLEAVCDQMQSEQLKPKEGMLAISRRLEQHNIAIPNEWNVEYRWKSGPKYKLHTLLEQHKLTEANEFYVSNGGDDIFGSRLGRYLLSKNAENGNIEFFKKMRSVLGVQFGEKKHILSFASFECKAYLKADKYLKYMEYVREDLQRCVDSMIAERNDVPVSVMDMMDKHEIYNQRMHDHHHYQFAYLQYLQ